MWRWKDVERKLAARGMETPVVSGSEQDQLRSQAVDIVRANDRGTYTVPNDHLYPYQWNWDSAITSMGWAHIKPQRAVTELESLLKGQWLDGRVPQIVFHRWTKGEYFPQPDYWGTQGREVETSTIIQHPILGLAAEYIFHRLAEDDPVAESLAALVPKIDHFHRFIAAERDPKRWHAAAAEHPWSGMDNGWQFYSAMQRIDGSKAAPFQRVDTAKVKDANERPTDWDYQVFASIVTQIRQSDFGPGPFAVYDPFMTTLLIRSDLALARLARDTGQGEVAERATARAAEFSQGLMKLYDPQLGRFRFYDANAETYSDVVVLEDGGKEIVVDTLAQYAPLMLREHLDMTPKQWHSLEQQYFDKYRSATVPLPTVPVDHQLHRPKSYWKGPSWPPMNFLFAAFDPTLHNVNLALYRSYGAREYHNPSNGEGYGATTQTWTAAPAIIAVDAIKAREGY